MIVLSAAAGALLQFAQARQSNQDEPIRLRGELVVLDAQVLHKKTALAVDKLVRDDFILYEDGVKQHISHFSQDKLPLSVVILMDVSGSVWPDRKSFERLMRGAFEAMKLLKQEDEVALMQFAAKATLLQPFTRDRDLVARALARLDGRGQIGTRVDSGILGAADYIRLASNSDSRRVIIAITDDVTEPDELTTKVDAASYSYVERQALHDLYESGDVLCAILYKSDHTGIDNPHWKKGIAKHFAEATGGISIQTSQEDIPAKLYEMI